MIPRKIKIGRKRYTIHQCKQPRHINGRIFYELQTIEIQPRDPRDMLGTFWHEITHAILYDMKDPRYRDEAFVAGFSQRLHKAIRSARFGPPPKTSGPNLADRIALCSR